MKKVFRVAYEEMRFHLGQWSFYLSLAFMVLTFAAFGFLPRLRTAAAESPLADVETVFSEEEALSIGTGYVDPAGFLGDVAAEQTPNLHAFPDEAAAAAALRRGEIERYYLIPSDYVASGKVTRVGGQSRLLPNEDAAMEKVLRRNLLASLKDATLAERLAQPLVLVRRGPPPALFDFIPANLESGRLSSALLLAGLFAYLINASSILLLRALQREVEWRVLEIMVTTVRPWQLIAGKLAGLSALVLGQAALVLAIGVLVYGRAASLATLPLEVMVIALPYLLLGYLAVSGAMLCIAALWPVLSESVQLQFIVRLLVLSPLLGGPFILPDPDSWLAIALTLNPITSPLLMPFRVLLADVPVWQHGAGLLLLLFWGLFLLWLSTHFFRANPLLSGRTPALSVIAAPLRALRR